MQKVFPRRLTLRKDVFSQTCLREKVFFHQITHVVMTELMTFVLLLHPIITTPYNYYRLLLPRPIITTP